MSLFEDIAHGLNQYIGRTPLGIITNPLVNYMDQQNINSFEDQVRATAQKGGLSPVQAFVTTLMNNPSLVHELPTSYITNHEKLLELMRPPAETVQAGPQGELTGLTLNPETGQQTARTIKPREPDMHFTEFGAYAVNPTAPAGQQVQQIAQFPRKFELKEVNGRVMTYDPYTQQTKTLFTVPKQAAPPTLGEYVAMDELTLKMVAGGLGDRMTGTLANNAKRLIGGDITSPDAMSKAGAALTSASRPSDMTQRYQMAIANGSPPDQARDIAAGNIHLSQPDPGSGNITMTNIRNGQSQIVTQDFANNVQPIVDQAQASQPGQRPAMALGSMPIETMAAAGNGAVSMVYRVFAHGVGQLIPGPVSVDQTSAVHQLETFRLAAKSIFGQGSGFGNARIMSQIDDVVPGGSTFTKPETAAKNMALVRDYLNTDIQQQALTFNNKALPPKVRQAAAQHMTDVQGLLKLMGPPPESAGSTNTPLASSPSLPGTAPAEPAAPTSSAPPATAPQANIPVKTDADLITAAQTVVGNGQPITITIQDAANPANPENGKTFTLDAAGAQKILDAHKTPAKAVK